jgi:nucleoside-diphosphate-sugar epimerase
MAERWKELVEMNYLTSDLYTSDLDKAWKHVVNYTELFHQAVMITGATGLIGSFLVDMFVYANERYDARIEIYALSRTREHLVQRFGESEKTHLHYIVQDVNCKFEQPDSVSYIIHAAGNSYPAAFRKDPVGTIVSNVQGTLNVLEYAKLQQTKRVLYVSTGEVYADVDLLSTRSCYPIGKRAGENLCVSFAEQYQMDVVIVRPCHTYGPNVTASDNRATVQFVNNALAGEDILLKSEGLQMRSYNYVADCASGLLTVLLEGENSQAYDLANPDSVLTVRSFAEKCAAYVGRKVICQLPDAVEKKEQSPIDRQVLCPDKLIALGWKPSYSIDEGIQHTISILQDEDTKRNVNV